MFYSNKDYLNIEFDYQSLKPERWSFNNNKLVVIMSKITVIFSVIFFKVFSNYIFELPSDMIYDLISF